MTVRVTWQAPNESVVEVPDVELRRAADDGVDVRDQFEVAEWVRGRIQLLDDYWLDEVRDEVVSEEAPEVLDVFADGEPPDWAYADESEDDDDG
jgi:hypothetical protein